MTFPSTYFDITKCVNKSAEAVNDRKKRVRQAALGKLLNKMAYTIDVIFKY